MRATVALVIAGFAYLCCTHNADGSNITYEYEKWRQDYFQRNKDENIENHVFILEDDSFFYEIAPQENSLYYKVQWPSRFISWSEEDGFPQVPFRIPDKARVESTAVKAAIKHWEDNTCITFKEIESYSFYPHIVFRYSEDSCYSMIGRSIIPFKGQPIGLAPPCQLKLGIIIHEIGHALGLVHEQSRLDRNQYVQILRKNIELRSIVNFFMAATETFTTPYDLNSVMHYSIMAFSRNGNSTVVSKDPLAQGLMGFNREGLSFMDKRIANLQYHCIDKWLTKCGHESDPCKNFGYTGKDCKCVCPAGTSGEMCTTRTKDYTEALIAEQLPHNSIITEAPATIQTPNYPTPQTKGTRFTTIITAPRCHTITITFKDFDLYPRCSKKNIGKCCIEGLEIRLDGDDIGSGTWYCGTEVKKDHLFESTGTKLVLFYSLFDHDQINSKNKYKGYQADVAFKPKPNC